MSIVGDLILNYLVSARSGRRQGGGQRPHQGGAAGAGEAQVYCNVEYETTVAKSQNMSEIIVNLGMYTVYGKC